MSLEEMNHEDRVRAALKALAEHDSQRESSLPAPRMRVVRPALRWQKGTAYAAAALAAAAVFLVLSRPAEQVQAPTATPEAEIETVSQSVSQRSVPEPEASPEPSRRVVPAARAILASAQDEPEPELATDFFPLTDSQVPFEHGQLVRVVVPASTMQRVGLPVRPERWSDRVTADVLVGDEGMPRAIRFVSFQQ